MARQETTNTFTEGLMCDFNPINVPNNALTDCLNGTIITYDGNEMSLQNDKGNYPLENCKLKENYIPVGIKEYGDILYIVSYNPIDNKVEVGSYPSTTQYSSSNPDNVLDNGIEIPDLNGEYNDIVGKIKSVMFIDKSWTLHPGDEYHLEKSSIEKQYVKLEYYIMDENKQLVKFEPEFTTETDKYENYKGTPGWLVVKPTIANIDKADINIRSMDIPEDIPAGTSKTATCKLVFSVQTSDGITDENCKDFYADYTIGDISGTADLNKVRDLYNGSLVFYSDIVSGNKSVYDDSVIKITFTPKLKTSDGEIIYKEESLEVKVSSKFDLSEFNLGNSYWKYNITDQNQLMLTFNTKGMESVTNTSHYSLKCTVSRFVENNGNISLYTLQENGSDKEFTGEWNTYGNSTYYFPLTIWEGNNSFDKDTLYKEDLYVINLTLCERGVEKSTISKLVVASEIMNGIEDVECYDNIDFDTILQRYLNTCCINKYTIDDWSPVVEDPGDTTNVIASDGYNIWTQKECYNKTINSKNITTSYDTCLSETTKKALEKFQNNLGYCFNAIAKATYKASLRIKPNVALLTGPLWSNLVENAEYNIFIDGDSSETLSFDGKTGFLNKDSVLIDNISGEYKIENRYVLKDCNTANLFDYKTRSIKYQMSEKNYQISGAISRNGFVDEYGKNYNFRITAGSNSAVMINGNTTGTLSIIRSFASEMFNGVDVGFVVIKIQAYYDGGGSNFAQLWWDYGKSEDWANCKTKKDKGGPIYSLYLAFKENLSGYTGMRLVPIKGCLGMDESTFTRDITTVFNKFQENTKNIQCTIGSGEDSKWSGYFITIEKSARKRNTGETVDLNIENDLRFNNFSYLGINMLKDKSVFTNLVSNNNLTNSNGEIDLLPIVVSDVKSKVINVSDGIKTTLESALNNFNLIVENRNTTVNGQQNAYVTDGILSNQDYDILEYSITSTSTTPLIAITNQLNKTSGSTVKASFWTEGHHIFSTVGTKQYVIAWIDNDSEITLS